MKKTIAQTNTLESKYISTLDFVLKTNEAMITDLEQEKEAERDRETTSTSLSITRRGLGPRRIHT